MFYTRIILKILLLLMATQAVFAQQRMFSKNEIQNEFDLVYNTLLNYHPNPFLYTSEQELNHYFETQKASLPNIVSELEFHALIRKLIAKIKCGHTYAKPSASWYDSVNGKAVQLPFDVKQVANRFYIRNTTTDTFAFSIDDEILSINTIPIQEIVKQMNAIQERDGHTNAFVNEQVIKNFRTYYLFLYGLQPSFTISYTSHNSEIHSTCVKPTNKALNRIEKPILPNNFTPVISTNWSAFSVDSSKQFAYLTISSFSDRKEYKAYYKSVFVYLKQRQIPILFIDLRNNGGGYFNNACVLLSYLKSNKFDFNFQKSTRKIEKNAYTKLSFTSKLTQLAFTVKPQKHKISNFKITTFSYSPNKFQFTGKLNVLINGNTFSQAAVVASHLNEIGADFYGEETGGTANGTNAMLNYTLSLPNSGIRVYIPHYRIVTDYSKSEFGQGVKPKLATFPNMEIN